ncbi:glycoside hydrolase family 108 protein [Dyadobacter sandarakinus]|uniref:Secretion activator protein n=1 Tax=Dyadobacter sandarakinus TaxID=2747268 RepID=A0ABX7I0Z7_9BACT|nr:glycosyl hydrolase 108 family protein [Dyadobacter sandarakinus]QRQ99731.1 secretion activator protein [Dyadobacter sandarakinus]
MTFEEAVEHVLSSEGGFTNNPNDPGNWTGGKVGKGLLKGTKWGISAASYPSLDIRNLTREGAILLYKKDYWDAAKVEDLPPKIRLHFFDVAVNSGKARAVKILQKASGVAADGIMGPVTVKNAYRVTPWDFASERVSFYVNHVKANPGSLEFLNGWIRRVLNVTKESL